MNNNPGGIINSNMGGMGGMSGMMNNMNDMNGIGHNMGGMDTNAIDPTVGMSVYTPQGSGTLISDIVKQNDEPTNNGQNNNHSMQRPVGNGGRIIDPYTGYPMTGNNHPSIQHRNPHNIYDRAEYNPQYNYKNERNDNRRQVQSNDTPQDDNDVSEYSNMRELANDVNNSLEALEQIENSTKYKKKKNKNASKNKETESDTENKENQNMPKDESKITLETIETETDYLKLFVEFLLLLTLYVVMSQPFIVSFASGYITQLNPDEEGAISMMGIIIYGLIMTIMFFVIRKIMFSKM